MIMTQGALPFQYQSEKNDSGLTGFAGLPLMNPLIFKDTKKCFSNTIGPLKVC